MFCLVFVKNPRSAEHVNGAGYGQKILESCGNIKSALQQTMLLGR